KLLVLPICIVILIPFILNLGCTGGSGNYRKPISASDATKKDAPNFTATTIDGEEITLSDYKGKKAVLVDLWGTWCGPCKMEMPELQKFYEAHSDDVEIIAAAQNDNLKSVQDYITKAKITFKIILDTGGVVGSKYPSRSVPFLTIINKDGKIVKTITGYRPGLGEILEDLLDLESKET
ncbi:MAG: TlpA disulfide reductase family protein, partial [bacterium]